MGVAVTTFVNLDSLCSDVMQHRRRADACPCSPRRKESDGVLARCRRRFQLVKKKNSARRHAQATSDLQTESQSATKEHQQK